MANGAYIPGMAGPSRRGLRRCRRRRLVCTRAISARICVEYCFMFCTFQAEILYVAASSKFTAGAVVQRRAYAFVRPKGSSDVCCIVVYVPRHDLPRLDMRVFTRAKLRPSEDVQYYPPREHTQFWY